MKSVELRPISLLTQDQVNNAVEIGEALSGPTAILGGSAPTFVKVQDAYIYPKKVAGTLEDRVEIYLEADLGVEIGDKIQVSGIHGTQNNIIDVTGDSFVIKHLDTPPWDNRDLPSGVPKDDPTNDQLSGVTITNAYSFVPETVAPTTWNTFYRLQTKRQVDTYAISGTTVSLVMNSNHRFEVGDIVFVDIFAEDSRAYGIDGLFRITAVTSNTITYTLDAGGVDEPVLATEPDEPVYVFPVAKKYLAVGSTWAEDSGNKIYYWDGIRWVDYSTVSARVQDGDPPAAPTNLEITSEGSVSTNVSIPTAKVTLSWTAPTLTKEGEELTDLTGYKIRWRKLPTEDWRVKDVRVKDATSYTFDDDAVFQQGTLYYFELYAYDSGLQDSDKVEGSHTTAVKTTPLSGTRPSAPQVESKLGTMTVKWDGFMATTPPTLPPFDVQYIKIHRSTVDDFTPSDSTLITTISAATNNYATFSDVSYNTDYYFKFVLIDTSGVQSLPSLQTSSRVTPLVDTDLLVGNVLNSWSFNGNLISAGALADGSINAASLLGPNVVTQEAISANAIGANQIAAGSIIAGKIGANAITSNSIAANAIYAGAIQANAIEADKIKVGALDGKLITGATVRTSANTSNVIMNDSGLYAYNNGALTFRILSSNGFVYIASGVQIGGYATTGELTTVSATATTANENASTALTTANSKLGPGQAAADVNAYRDTTTIDGGAITTGTLDANRIKADTVLSSLLRVQDENASLGRIEIRGSGANRGIVAFKSSGGGTANATFRLYTANGEAYLKDTFIDGDVTVSGGRIVAGSTVMSSSTITGGIIRTSTSGKRVEMRDDTNSVRFYNSSGSIAGEIEGLTLGARFDSALGSFLQVGGGVTMGSGTTTATSVTSSGLTLLVAPTTTFAANLRRPDAGNVIQVVSSDLRIKENVLAISDGISVVNQLNPVTFNSRVDGTDKVVSGFLAQDVANILPVENYTVVTEVEGTIPDFEGAESLGFNENPLLSLNHIELLPYLTKAIQELSQKNSDLENRISSLESSGD